MINSNPVFDSKYDWKDVEVTFDDDFKEIVIRQGENKIVVQGSFFSDVCFLMDQIIKEGDSDNKIWYSLRTTLSCPKMKW